MNTDGDNLETQWSTFKDTVFDTAKSVLGYSKRKQPDWFDESNQEIKDLLAKKRAAHNACLNDKSSQKKHDQYRWLRSQAHPRSERLRMPGGRIRQWNFKAMQTNMLRSCSFLG